jgi:hypothetical protein
MTTLANLVEVDEFEVDDDHVGTRARLRRARISDGLRSRLSFGSVEFGPEEDFYLRESAAVT